ncbi:uncharacterized protein LOC126752810 [Bactrocera neohumeralis]|uniref:uncharacterized protein LOC126752810 n=1 Tax=Bactrocera neohumeralis TaxID=98809 RepID=UPI0021661312|nr:uncharacterized protein LOC126752810 [Bactrocera neohumeralis]
MANKTVLTVILLAITFVIVVHSKLDFTNVKCISLDNSTVYFDICLLKSVNRTYKYLSIRARFPRKQPTYDIKVNFAILRRENGYKPFLYNITIDACKYLKTHNNPVIRFAHQFFEKYSTVNRTCPYGQDEVLDKLPVSYVNNLITSVLPLPHGDYAYQLTFYLYNKKLAIATVYASFM